MGPPGLERTGRLLRAIRTRRSQPAGWSATFNEHRDELTRMDAAQDDVSQVPSHGDSSAQALSADPISRLEAEIEQTERLPGATTAEESERLLEETWSLFTECLVIRDGLLEACDEIERTMGGLQRKLGALPVALQPGQPPHADGPLDELGPKRITANGNGNGNGNGAHGHIDATGSNGHTAPPSSNGHSNGTTSG